jgi:hypothetical protein
MSLTRSRKLKLLSMLVLGLACFIADLQGTLQTQPLAASASPVVRTEMRNVMYHFTDQAGVHIARLEGIVVPLKGNSLPVFDDPHSFLLAVDFAEISMRTDSLSNVLNQYVFAGSDSPIKDVAITIQGNMLKVKGKLHSKGDAPFETDGTMEPTEDGQIRVQARKIKALKLPVKGLMDLLGLKLADLVSTKKVDGVRLEGDDLILDPQKILPPPHIQGKVTAVRLVGGEIVMVIGDQNYDRGKVAKAPPPAGNYMAYRGAQLRFGKLTMADTDLILMDMDPKDPFDFYLDHYKQQLAAGYTKETLDFGLRVYMPDYNKLPKRAPSKTGAATPPANTQKTGQL